MRFLSFLLFTLITVKVFAQDYQVFIDLNELREDKIPVEIEYQDFSLKDSIEFQMPKIVPGTYSISDFGRVVSDLKAYDKEGQELPIVRIDQNRWQILEAEKLNKVNYWVEDTFDDTKYSEIFEPGGTNFEDSNYLLNHFAIIAYLEGYEKVPFTLHIQHPDSLYGATPLKRETISAGEDLFYSDTYMQLIDSPIMYSKADTTSVMIGNTQVMVSVYSPEGKINAQDMMAEIEPTLIAQGQYLGGELPVDKYLILVYLHKKRTNSGLMGALEHSYSTVFSYPETQISRLSRSIVGTTSHEFFHVITPLTIHSEEIGDYDFIEPKMSKHLWLYEGLTEYTSMRVQAMFGLITPDEFLDEILDKKQTSLFYNDTLPFTELSLGALDLYEDQYMNVYQKGALIGLCLDLLLLKDSNGEYDVRMLMNDLASMYGINKSFKDDELFDIITAISYPNTREFFKKYVEGKEALPLKEYLEFVGVNYLPGEVVSINSLGNIGIGFDPDKNQIIIADAGSNKGYGRKIGLEDGDVLLKMLGEDVTMDNYRMVFQSYFSLAAGAKFYMDVERVNKRGKVIHKRLKGKVLQVETVIGERLQWEENPTYMQITLRRSWINEHQY